MSCKNYLFQKQTSRLFRKSSNYLNYSIPYFPRINRYIQACHMVVRYNYARQNVVQMHHYALLTSFRIQSFSCFGQELAPLENKREPGFTKCLDFWELKQRRHLKKNCIKNALLASNNCTSSSLVTILNHKDLEQMEPKGLILCSKKKIL